MQFKLKRIAVALAATMAFSAVSASAEWIFAGYDTRDLNDIQKVYNEKVDGFYTDLTATEPVDPDDIEWRFESYEYAYPHAGYDRLYIEGNAQAITRYNNMFPQWETRLKDSTWEICGDHRIWQRQQTKIPGIGWTWDYAAGEADYLLYTPTTRYAETVDSFKLLGFADLDLEGKKVSKDVADMYKRFGVYMTVEDMLNGALVDVNNDGILENLFDPEVLSARDEKGNLYVTDELISGYVASIQGKLVTGPSFYGENPTKDVSAKYLSEGKAARENWYWDADTVRFGGAEISWTDYDYEAAEQYDFYQCLVVNGVVCDGSNDTPRIWRKLGNKATPDVSWEYLSWNELKDMLPDNIFIDADDHDVEKILTYDVYGNAQIVDVHDIVEWKHVDGKPIMIELADGSEVPYLRIPTGEYAKCYTEITDTEIQLWRQTNRGPVELIGAVSRVNHDLGYFNGYINATVDVFGPIR